MKNHQISKDHKLQGQAITLSLIIMQLFMFLSSCKNEECIKRLVPYCISEFFPSEDYKLDLLSDDSTTLSFNFKYRELTHANYYNDITDETTCTESLHAGVETINSSELFELTYKFLGTNSDGLIIKVEKNSSYYSDFYIPIIADCVFEGPEVLFLDSIFIQNEVYTNVFRINKHFSNTDQLDYLYVNNNLEIIQLDFMSETWNRIN